MKKLLLVLALSLFATVASAQTCPTRPDGTHDNSCASTAFVQNALNNSADYYVYATPAALAAATIPANITYANVATMAGAFSVNGTPGTCSLTFVKGTTSPTGVYGEIQNAVSGIYWLPRYSNSPVRACEFKTLGDGVYNYTTGAVTGTDNQAQINAALSYALQNGFEAVCLNDGYYKTTDTLQVGYGGVSPFAFLPIALVSCNTGRSTLSNTRGAVQIFPTQIDRCAINIQGTRQSAIRGLTIVGQNWVFLHGLIASIPYPVTESGWLDPALVKSGTNPGGLQTNSAYSGICIDAYAGSAPAAAYPAVTYPAWTGIVTQYNKNRSSNIQFSDVTVQGFAVGINSEPNSNGNGDFINTCRIETSFNTYGFSIGNNQARNTKDCDTTAQGMFAALTNQRFGNQNGKIGGPLSNMSVGQSYEVFDLSVNLGTPLVIENLYAESIVRIGFIGASSTVATASVIFNGGQVQTSTSQTGVIPVTLIQSGGNPQFIFNGLTKAGASRISVLVDSADVQVNGGLFQDAQDAPTFNNAGIQRAVNYTGSVFPGTASTFQNSILNNLTWLGNTNAVYMVDPTHVNSSQTMGPYAFPADGIHAQFSQSVDRFVDLSNNRVWQIAAGPQTAVLQLKSGSFTSVAPAYTSCDVMTFTYIGAKQAAQDTAITVGDILYNTGSANYGLFVVTAVGGVDGSGNYPITTRQMNGMTVNASDVCQASILADPTIPGVTNLIHTGVLIPTKVYFGYFDISTTTVVNVSQGVASTGSTLDTYVSVGDIMRGYTIPSPALNWPYASGTTLSTVTNGTPGTIVLSTNPLQSGVFPILQLPVIGGAVPNVSGLSVTKTVRAGGGLADCTLTYILGWLTASTCP